MNEPDLPAPPVMSRPRRLLVANLLAQLAFGLLAMTLSILSMQDAFLAGAPVVLGSYGVKPDGIGLYLVAIPPAYILGNFLTSRRAHRIAERPLMALGQCLTLGGLALVVALALAGVITPLALALPLLLGIDHGLLVPAALSGSVSLVPALAGSAAAVAGLMQQLMGAAGGFAVGLFDHQGALNLGWLMLGLAGCSLLAPLALHRRRA